MEILDDKILAKNIFQKYTVNPKNWNFIISTTSIQDGFFDATITSPDEAWQLKIDSLYKPLPIITGTKLDIESSKMKKMFNKDMAPFGYRKIDPPMIINLFKKISQEQETIARKDMDYVNNELNSFLGSLEPTVPEKGIDYLYGPFLFTNKNIIENNPYHKNISEKLATNLKKKIKDRYPSYG
ncbi:MAG: hypothetical protein M3M88_02570 [Thermoproteota archaeon]|nr:hypothetical protein [Thermoproteota archaeon]